MNTTDLIDALAAVCADAAEHLRDTHPAALGCPQATCDARVKVEAALALRDAHDARERDLADRLHEAVNVVRRFSARHGDACEWCHDLEAAATDAHYDHRQRRERG